jgi:PAS domain S-box-containing protein
MPSVDHSFLTNGGETGTLIAAFDWAATPLGPIESWPQSLKTATALLLRSPVPIVMLWGEDGFMLYNDAYSGFAGLRHPRLLGSKVREGWPEVADFNDNVMKVGLAGGTLAYREQELALNRHGRIEPAWLNLDYSPVIDESGQPAGVIAIVVEVTDRILGERRSALLTTIAETLRGQSDPREITTIAAELIGVSLGVDCAGYGEVADGPDGRVSTIEDAWHAPGARSIVGVYHLDRYASTFMADFEAGRPVVFEDVANDPRTADTTEGERIRALGIRAQVVVPLVKDGELAALLFVHSGHPRIWTAEDVSMIRAAAERTWSELARARAEQALRRGEERMRLALVAGGFSDWYWNAATDRIRFSPRAAANLGIPPTFEPSSKDIAAAVIEEDRAATLAAGEKALEDGEPYLIEYRMMRPNRELAWIATYGQPVRGEDGKVVGVIGISQEITARKQADEALREREQQLSAFVSQTTAGLAQVDLTGRFTLVNDRFCEITGYSREILLERTMQSITHADDLRSNMPLFERAVAEGTSYVHEKRYIRPDGSTVWVNNSVAVIRRASGEPYGVLAVTLDVTERRRAEEALRKSEESIRLAIEGAGMAAWEMDLETMVGIWSSNRFDLLGYPRRADRRGTVEEWLDRIHPEDRPMVAAATARCFSEGAPFTLEYRIHRADNGEERWLHSYGNRIDDRPGEPARFVGVSFDITGQKRAEQHQRLLINELNHRVKNTLAIVQAISHQSFAGEGLSRDARRAFEGRLAALSAAHNLLTDQNWEGATLHQIIADGMAAYHVGERVTIHGPDLPLAPKTSVSLAMAVHELATNATKYGSLSRPGGRIDIGWEVEDGRLHLVWRESGGPPVAVPTRRGFGSRMIERGLASELSGTVKIDFAPAGLVCTVDAPLPHGSDL